MSKKKEINTYTKLEHAGSFFLHEAFTYLNIALEREFANIQFSKELSYFEPSPDDIDILNKIEYLPNDSINILQSETPNVFSKDTLILMRESWIKALAKSKTEKHKFKKEHRIDTIEILGHINNFGFFIETLVNRHLLFLNQTGVIDDFSYKKIYRSGIMDRLIYIFKDDLCKSKVHLNEITCLFTLRNKTVHFTPDNATALKPKISELLQIHTQSVIIIKRFEEKEKFIDEVIFSKELESKIEQIKSRWL